jgi:hypothetical protein
MVNAVDVFGVDGRDEGSVRAAVLRARDAARSRPVAERSEIRLGRAQAVRYGGIRVVSDRRPSGGAGCVRRGRLGGRFARLRRAAARARRRRFTNFAIVGPSVSATHDAAGSLRVLPATIAEGEAAGAACTVSVRASASSAPPDELHDQIRKRREMLVVPGKGNRGNGAPTGQVEALRRDGRVAHDHVLADGRDRLARRIDGRRRPVGMRDTGEPAEQARAHEAHQPHRAIEREREADGGLTRRLDEQIVKVRRAGRFYTECLPDQRGIDGGSSVHVAIIGNGQRVGRIGSDGDARAREEPCQRGSLVAVLISERVRRKNVVRDDPSMGPAQGAGIRLRRRALRGAEPGEKRRDQKGDRPPAALRHVGLIRI